MTHTHPHSLTTIVLWLAAALTTAAVVVGCGAGADGLNPGQIEQQYGVSGAFVGSVATPNGPMQGTIIPITLADGTSAQLVVPQRQASDVRSVYLVDSTGLHPVELGQNVTRQDVSRGPTIVPRRPAPAPAPATTRSWEKEVLIVGGSAGAGTAIGAIAGGKKGAAVGAAAGGVGGLIYDLLTRDKK